MLPFRERACTRYPWLMRQTATKQAARVAIKRLNMRTGTPEKSDEWRKRISLLTDPVNDLFRGLPGLGQLN